MSSGKVAAYPDVNHGAVTRFRKSPMTIPDDSNGYRLPVPDRSVTKKPAPKTSHKGSQPPALLPEQYDQVNQPMYQWVQVAHRFWQLKRIAAVSKKSA